MKIERLSVPDVLLVTPLRYVDERGSFSETFRADFLAAHGVHADFVQDNHVVSNRKGVVRGLHYQIVPCAQGKLVRCSRGAILDVAVDVREGSPHYAKHVAIELSDVNWQQLWIPPGFAHGYLTLCDDCEVLYKTTGYYSPDHERGIAWDDPALEINWPISPANAILSDKDRNLPSLGELARRFY